MNKKYYTKRTKRTNNKKRTKRSRKNRRILKGKFMKGGSSYNSPINIIDLLGVNENEQTIYKHEIKLLEAFCMLTSFDLSHIIKPFLVEIVRLNNLNYLNNINNLKKFIYLFRNSIKNIEIKNENNEPYYKFYKILCNIIKLNIKEAMLDLKIKYNIKLIATNLLFIYYIIHISNSRMNEKNQNIEIDRQCKKYYLRNPRQPSSQQNYNNEIIKIIEFVLENVNLFKKKSNYFIESGYNIKNLLLHDSSCHIKKSFCLFSCPIIKDYFLICKECEKKYILPKEDEQGFYDHCDVCNEHILTTTL